MKLQEYKMLKNMIIIFLLVIIPQISFATRNRLHRQTDTCGVPKIEMGMIVQGQDFIRGSLPWIVALMHLGFSPPAFFCGGTLISKNFVISGNL